jgi:hypothetical protein
MKNKKHYYENLSNPVNSFKITNSTDQIHGHYLNYNQIQYLKFKFFWIGFAAGGILLTLFYIALNFYLKLLS